MYDQVVPLLYQEQLLSLSPADTATRYEMISGNPVLN